MNKYQIKLVELIKSELNPDTIKNLSIVKKDWPEMYSLIIQQGLVSVLYPVMNLLGEDVKPEPTLGENWKYNVLINATHQLRRIQQLNSIVEQFDAAELPIIVIKGPAIARFYDNPECRSMSDLDILVEDKYLTQARQIIESMGYELVIDQDDPSMHYGYKKPGHLYIELHYGLMEPSTLGWRDLNQWYRHIWENRKMITFEDVEISVMAEEDEIINQVVHLAIHMLYGGVRMKHLYDIALLIKSCRTELDWDYIGAMLKGIKLLQFGRLVFTTCNDFLGTEIPEQIKTNKGMTSEQFIDIFLNKYCIKRTVKNQRVWRWLACKKPALYRSLMTLPIIYVLEYWVHLTKFKRNPWSSLVATNYNIKIFADRVRTQQILGMND